jgi:RNA polymerase I-specific transcription initiation factor RRN7
MTQVVCRDLWALHLSLLREPPPSEPDLAAQESDAEDRDDGDGKSSRSEFYFEDPKLSSSDDEDGVKAEKVDPNLDEVKNEEADSELDELLAENSASESSSSDGEDEVDETKVMPPGKKSKGGGLSKFEQPANTLAVIVLAFWTLRIPILYADLTRCVAKTLRAHIVYLTGCVAD